MEHIKKFMKVAKNYINYIMKLDFKELFVNFIELIILIIIAMLLVFPVDLVRELLFKIIASVTGFGEGFYKIYDIIFTIIKAVVCFGFFIYMFNKRYEDISKIRPRRDEKMFSNNEEISDFQRKNVEDEKLELPKQAEKKKF